ncbi:MAG: ABC transporter permease [Candidatus Omnitrophota bacterium]|nr:MAG: ABC transporter permease [Candidatus Omnitrophota bacterium]
MRRMGKAILMKTANAIITIFAVITFNFFLFRVMPGDPARVLLPKQVRASPELIEKLRRFYGLDKPLHVQFINYVVQVFQGKLGYSFAYHEPVARVIMDYIWNTILLVGVGEGIAIILGIILGAVAAWRRGEPFDLTVTALNLIFWSMPEFWLGMVFILVFGRYLKILPTSGIVDPWLFHENVFSYVADVLRHLILPSTTLALIMLASYYMIMRNTLIDVTTEDYIRTAKAKGFSEKEILWKHAVPNALLPTVTTVAIGLASVISGALTIEIVFSWPGMGWLTYQAIVRRDYPLLQAIFLITSALVIIANLFADIIYTYLDPRVKI